MTTKSEIQDLYYAISADIEHGECFYDEEMFKTFLENVDELRERAKRLFEEKKQVSEDEEE